MNFKNSNLVNIFKPAKVNNNSLALLVFVFLPAIFVTKTIESTLIYLLLSFIFLVVVTLVSKLIELVVVDDIKWLVYILTLISVAVLISIFHNAVFVSYSLDYNLYTYLLPVSALPYMLIEDNKQKTFSKGMLNTVESFIGLVVVMLLVSIFREILGTGMITFGKYTNLSFTVKLFENYALTLFQNSLGAIIILGFLFTLINKRGDVK